MIVDRLPVESLTRHRRIAADGFGLSRGVVLVPSGLPLPIEGTDAYHEFHAHDEHLWLAGTHAPGQVLAFEPRDGYVLFAHVASEEERIWEGAGESIDEIRARTGLGDVRPREELTAWLAARSGESAALLGATDFLRRPAGYGFSGTAPAIDGPLSKRLSAVITDARRTKDEGELGLMRAAAAATTAGHLAALRSVRPGITERRLQVEIESAFFRAGGRRTAYGSIVAAGENAAILHSTPGLRTIEEDDLVLVDAGAEYGGYKSDVTRTFPASGRYSGFAADLYDLVLSVQKAATEKLRPGREYREIHLEACVSIAEGLVDLGLLRGRPESLVERDAHALFFPHGIGHLIGLATHDVGGYAEGRTRSDRFGLKWLRTDLPLQPGYVVTIEPGIYFIGAVLSDPARRERYRDAVDFERADSLLSLGGIRIEDDVHVTEGAPEVLTAAIPKERAAVEQAIAEGRR